MGMATTVHRMQNLGVTLAKPVLVFEWTLGAKYNHPEKNCCACGKASVSQSGTSGPTNEALWNSIQYCQRTKHVLL